MGQILHGSARTKAAVRRAIICNGNIQAITMRTRRGKLSPDQDADTR